MRYLPAIFIFLSFLACNDDPAQKANNEPVVEKKKKVELPTVEGQRNKRGYPIGTIQEATQMLAGAKGKQTIINQYMTDLLKGQANGQDLLAIGKPMERIRPMIRRLDSITTLVESGQQVQFLSDRDLGKIELRQQTQLDALIDSLSYLNSLLDLVLRETDEILMRNDAQVE
jgi:hypothetical protein